MVMKFGPEENGDGPVLPEVPVQALPTIWTYENIQGVKRDDTGLETPVHLVLIRISHPTGNTVVVLSPDEAEDISVKIHNQAVQAKHGFIRAQEITQFKPNGED